MHPEHYCRCDGRKEGNLCTAFDGNFACFLPNQDLTLILFVFRDFWSKITITWQECEHEDVDTQAMNDPNCLKALRNCGLLEFFLKPGMRAQPELLRYLISFWNINQEIFIISNQELELETSYIYFITGLS